jgi:dephospho-CoA kinase
LTEHFDPGRQLSANAARRIVIGLTGSIAAGKSTVAALLAEQGALIIDADVVYRSLLQASSSLSLQVAAAFGPRVIADNAIDRTSLAEIVFKDPEALAKLERIAHPAVEAQIVEDLQRTSARLVVIEAIKLIQSGLVNLVDSLWVVTARPDVRLRRLVECRGLSEGAAKARMAASDTVVPSCVQPDVVIDNSGDLQVARAAVESALGRLQGDENGETES